MLEKQVGRYTKYEKSFDKIVLRMAVDSLAGLKFRNKGR
jgi:hypothetical protein